MVYILMTALILQVIFIVPLFYKIRIEKSLNVLSLDNTNVMRYICCYIVLISHILDKNHYLLLGYLHFVCVTLFFLLSGYGLTKSLQTDKEKFLKKHPLRLLKIIIPYVSVLLFELIFQLPLARGGLFWFNTIIFLYIIYGLAINCCKNKTQFIYSVSVITILYIIITQIGQKQGGVFQYFGWGNQAMGFLIGIYIAEYYDFFVRVIDKYKWCIIGVASVCLLICGCIYAKPHDISVVTTEQFFLRWGISFSMIALLFVFMQHVSVNNKLVCYIGKEMSLSIFLIHGILINISEKIFNSEESIYWLAAPFVVVSTYTIAWIISVCKKMLKERKSRNR